MQPAFLRLQDVPMPFGFLSLIIYLCLRFLSPDQWVSRPGGHRAMSGGHLLLSGLGVLLAPSGWGRGAAQRPVVKTGHSVLGAEVKPCSRPESLHQHELHPWGWRDEPPDDLCAFWGRGKYTLQSNALPLIYTPTIVLFGVEVLESAGFKSLGLCLAGQPQVAPPSF